MTSTLRRIHQHLRFPAGRNADHMELRYIADRALAVEDTVAHEEHNLVEVETHMDPVLPADDIAVEVAVSSLEVGLDKKQR